MRQVFSAARRNRQEAWCICDRAHTYRREPLCQIAGPPIDEAIGRLIAEQMTPAAVELALNVRKEIEARHEEPDRLRVRAIKRAQTEAHPAQRRFMLVDPNSPRCHHARRQMEREAPHVGQRPRGARARPTARSIHPRQSCPRAAGRNGGGLQQLWANPDTPIRERKRLLAHFIEDVTLQLPAEATTKLHVRFKRGKIQTLTTMSPKSSA